MAKTMDQILAEIEAYSAAHPWRVRIRSVWRRTIRAPGRAYRSTRWAYQRVSRGWDDRALWSLDNWLAKTLGKQLQELARVAHGYPGEDHGWSFDAWVQAISDAGVMLSHYAATDSLDVTPVEWDDACDGASDALRWVAEHLPHLWD